MPLYEYRCQKCGARFELLRRMQDADLETECPQCRSRQSERLLSSFASRSGSSSASSSAGNCACAPAGSRFS
jgi:putative FmdB family regulatory protein